MIIKLSSSKGISIPLFPLVGVPMQGMYSSVPRLVSQSICSLSVCTLVIVASVGFGCWSMVLFIIFWISLYNINSPLVLIVFGFKKNVNGSKKKKYYEKF